MLRSALYLVILHAAITAPAVAATPTQLAAPWQQAEGPPPTPVGDPYIPPGTDILAPQAPQDPSPLDPTED